MKGMPGAFLTLVVGANRGIGLELCKQLHARGDQVIGVCRSASPELKGLGLHKVIEGVDIASPEAVARLPGQLDAGATIDNLWLNAGIGIGIEDSLEDMDFDGVRQSFEVNAMGPLRCVQALLPSLKKGSKILLMTSRMGSVADNTSGASYGYRMSKAGLNIAGKSLAIDLKPKGVAVCILHPGFVQTDMTKPYWGEGGIISAEASAQKLIQRADELSLKTTGRFLHMNGEELPW